MHAWQKAPERPAHWAGLVELLAQQNPQAGAAASLAALRQGAGITVTGQQVGLFGGELYSPLKAATAVARAHEATAQGEAHVPVFWMATEDHDFAEINHAFFPARREMVRLSYEQAPQHPVPVGGLVLDEAILPLIERLWELLGPSEATEALERHYKPGHTLAEAFSGFYREAFAGQGLLVLDPAGRAAHRMGAGVLAAGIERADELHAALVERNHELERAGYHAQVAVGAQSSLLFLIDEKSGARLALKRLEPSAREPEGLWVTLGAEGRRNYSTADLLAILASEPERISPSALLRPLFQDQLLGTSLVIGGPAEIAYYAQSAVLYERILGRVTASAPRFSATIIGREQGALLKKYGLSLSDLIGQSEDTLQQRLAHEAIAPEQRAQLTGASESLEAALAPLVGWLKDQEAGLGASAETSARKMRYQMHRLERLAARLVLQREERIGRDASTLLRELFPGTLAERRLAGACFFARHGFALAGEMVRQAEACRAGHAELWME